ncbi:MAG TPA: C-GCAxxG-C-C family protein [Terriglobales bacterium]|nr:C-GCAxxG-C-C family protein [Terriglobales bacterium]
MDDREMLAALRAQKLCCAQILVAMGLWLKGEENERLVEAAGGLCLGLYSGLLCGTLTGAVMMLNLFDRETAKTELIPRLTEWFEDEMTGAYGGIACADVIGADPSLKAVRCPAIIEKTYFEAKRLLTESGQLPEG